MDNGGARRKDHGGLRFCWALPRRLGFDEVQGFVLAKPVAPAVLVADFL